MKFLLEELMFPILHFSIFIYGYFSTLKFSTKIIISKT